MSKSEWIASLRVLGLPQDATRAQVQSTYRRLALRYHPDVNRSDDAHRRFREIAEAFQSLDEVMRLKEAADTRDVVTAVRTDPVIAKMSSPRLRRHLRRSPVWQVRASAAAALSLRDGGEETLVEAMQDADRRVRQLAARLVAELVDPRNNGKPLTTLTMRELVGRFRKKTFAYFVGGIRYAQR
ncbi:MAG: J domain-containing protein [Spirochaetaceae bacterium]|nr:MAG: J domain-containing protein [Spirochaetaceae bacterium]